MLTYLDRAHLPLRLAPKFVEKKLLDLLPPLPLEPRQASTCTNDESGQATKVGQQRARPTAADQVACTERVVCITNTTCTTTRSFLARFRRASGGQKTNISNMFSSKTSATWPTDEAKGCHPGDRQTQHDKKHPSISRQREHSARFAGGGSRKKYPPGPVWRPEPRRSACLKTRNHRSPLEEVGETSATRWCSATRASEETRC